MDAEAAAVATSGSPFKSSDGQPSVMKNVKVGSLLHKRLRTQKLLRSLQSEDWRKLWSTGILKGGPERIYGPTSMTLVCVGAPGCAGCSFWAAMHAHSADVAPVHA